MKSTEMMLRKQIRVLLFLFIVGLVLSGVTAFPLQWELETVGAVLQRLQWNNEVSFWISKVADGLASTYGKYPFIAYGTDWLAFAHLVIAVAFIGPLKDPVKNIWVDEFGMIACVSIFPLAFIAGTVRGIPFFWQLIDCSFGVIGGALLLVCYQKIKFLEKLMSISVEKN